MPRQAPTLPRGAFSALGANLVAAEQTLPTGRLKAIAGLSSQMGTPAVPNGGRQRTLAQVVPSP